MKLRQGQKKYSKTCLGYGYPNPRTTWKYNNTDIPEDPKSSIRNGIYQRRSTNNTALKNVSSTLYFNQSGSTFDDFGNYTCEVSIEKDSKTDSKIIRVICKLYGCVLQWVLVVKLYPKRFSLNIFVQFTLSTPLSGLPLFKQQRLLT